MSTLLNDKYKKFVLRETTKATGVISIFFSAKGSHISFNDGTKQKNSGPTLSATTSIIFSAVVVVAVSGGSRHILLGGPRRAQCLTRGAQKKGKQLY